MRPEPGTGPSRPDSSGRRFRILERMPDITLLHQVEPDGTLWGTHNRTILRRSSGADWRLVGSFPFRPPRDFCALTRLSARASRADKCNLFVNSEKSVLGIRDSVVYRIDGDGRLYSLFDIRGDSVLPRGICEDPEGWTYFGEYFQNKTRGPVRIYRLSPDLSVHEVAYEFHTGSIRHVHAIHRDPFDPQALWATVGDYAGECFLFRTRDRFRTLEKFGDGTQTWRAVGLLFTENHINWITDSHLDTNHACRMDRATGELEIGQEIDCSSWYCATTLEGLHVAFTTVEKGPAIHRNQASILASRDAFSWEELASFEKDFWRPMSVFKYGVISCPAGHLSAKNFYLSGEGLVGLDGESLKVALEPWPDK